MEIKVLYAGICYGLLVILPPAAWRWGEKPEWLASLAFLIATIASIGLRGPRSNRYEFVAFGLATVDVALLFFLLTLTLRTDRRWLVFATAFQAISSAAHLGMLIEPRFNRYAYNLMETFSTLPVLCCLAIGIWSQARRSERA